MRKIICCLIVFIFLGKLHSQEYNVISSLLKNNKVNLSSNFVRMDYGFTSLNDQLVFDEAMLRDLWEPMKSSSTPDIDFFLNEVSLDHLNNFVKNRDTSEINFDMLPKHFTKVSNTEQYLKNNRTVVYVSKPFINCSKNWAIFLAYSAHGSVASGGKLYIYQKIDGKWILYHWITTFTS